jgi:hypothetical protein
MKTKFLMMEKTQKMRFSELRESYEKPIYMMTPDEIAGVFKMTLTRPDRCFDDGAWFNEQCEFRSPDQFMRVQIEYDGF